MKVNIGPYLTYWGPHQITKLFFFWTEDYPKDELYDRWDYKLRDKISDYLCETWLNDFCNWVYNKRNRKEYIRIDKYDTWGMDSTLALIIEPMLIQLKATKHGAPLVSDDDVPDELKSTSAEPKENDYDVDSNHFKRWDWAMDEMIFAFNYINNELEYDCPKFGDGSYDWDTHRETGKRVDNGLRLFGTYYRGLWD